MSYKEPFGYQKPALSDQELATKLDRVDELVSTLLDDELDDTYVGELEALLLDSTEARSQYIGMIQLHTDLMEFYNPSKQLDLDSPVLSQLTQSPTGPTSTQQPTD
ncbi:hypothetical protein [Aeoliella mucimassa]|uniref:hypothetical protein n=1 Tax=Aeoliella mucimassa TaxID=2527972 RepID=UPI0011A1AC04|nr:hypothetical protein [Aeoliella mucimassa]